MRRKKLLELPFLHSNLKGRVLYLEYVNPKLISIDSRSIERTIEAPKVPLPFSQGDFDSFYIDLSKGHNDVEFLLSEVARLSRPGAVILLKLYDGPEFADLKQRLAAKKFIFDKSLRIPYLRRFWGPRKIYATFNLVDLVTEIPLQRVSVVVPMYNCAATLQMALSSVEAQTYPIHEVVLVDDGSTDDTVSVARSFIAKTKLRTQLITQANAGPSKARNAGVALTSGDMVAFLDSDDSWEPSKIDTQVRVLVSFPQAGLVSCNRNREHFPRFLVFGFGTFVRLPLKLHLIKNFCPTPTVLVRRRILDRVSFDESMKHLEDLDLWIRISRDYDCYLINESLACTGDGKPNFGHSGLSKNIVQMERGELRCIWKAWRSRCIRTLEYFFFTGYSVVKFLRRILIVARRS